MCVCRKAVVLRFQLVWVWQRQQERENDLVCAGACVCVCVCVYVCEYTCVTECVLEWVYVTERETVRKQDCCSQLIHKIWKKCVTGVCPRRTHAAKMFHTLIQTKTSYSIWNLLFAFHQTKAFIAGVYSRWRPCLSKIKVSHWHSNIYIYIYIYRCAVRERARQKKTKIARRKSFTKSLKPTKFSRMMKCARNTTVARILLGKKVSCITQVCDISVMQSS